RRRVLGLVALAIAGIGAFGVMRHLGGDAEPAAREPMAVTAELVLESIPVGARVTLDGEVLAARTPTRVAIDAGQRHAVGLDLPGHRPWRDVVEARPGERLRLAASLVPVHVRLEVVTEPEGASVRLGDEVLGETPLERDDLAP